MNFSENQPIYQQISDYFCNQILKKEWDSEDRLPSVREIAVQLEVNPNTALRAYHYLQEMEIIYNKRGVGYFVAFNAYEKVLNLKREEFINHELPSFFQKMNLLGFSYPDLEDLYKKHHQDG